MRGEETVTQRTQSAKQREHKGFFTSYVSLFSVLFLYALCVTPSSFAAELFDDPVIAKGKGLLIRESDVEEAFVAHKAAAAAMGQRAPEALEGAMKEQILQKMIATKLILARATPQDLDEGKLTAARMIADGREKAGSEASYRRRLLAVGSSVEKYETEILEQAIVQAVIDRELRKKEIVGDAEVRKYYEEHPDLYQEPARARVQHILFATRKIPSGEPLSLPERAAKKAVAEKAAARARAGEDFGKLVAELSEDPESKPKGGELTFARGKSVVPPQFEAAAFSLEPGKVSDPVLTVFGYHIIKLIEKIPADVVPFERVEDRIRQGMQRDAVQKKLPEFISKLREDAGVEVLGN